MDGKQVTERWWRASEWKESLRKPSAAGETVPRDLRKVPCQTSYPHEPEAMSRRRTHTFTWELLGDVLLATVVPGEIEGDRWEQYLVMLRDKRVRTVMALVQGSVSIDAKKRKGAADGLNERGMEVVVVTDSRMTRGMLTAMSWLGAKFRAFSWTELDKALQQTGATASTQDQLRKAALDFKNETADIAVKEE